MKRVFWLVLVLPTMLGACNTIRGFGQDMSAAGRALSDASAKVAGGEPTPAQMPASGSSAMPRGPVAPWPAPPSPEPLPRAPQEPEEPK